MSFPETRMRRLRQNESLRSLVRETRLTPESLIYPLFVCPGEGVRRDINSMPGVFNLSVDEALKEAREAKSLGLGGIILFGLPETKDEAASGAWSDDGIVQRAARAIKSEVKDLLLIGDVCLCEYTSHGHCGIIGPGAGKPAGKQANVIPAHSFTANRERSATATAASASVPADYEILNDQSVQVLARAAVSQVQAGVDLVAPSDMMDGRVSGIRNALDSAGFPNTPILSYAAKFASGFYGPFREAADSTPQFGDRRSYQMDGANVREAMREIELDIEEGADMIMVKPALPYLDVIAAARERFLLPLAAYQVSGEYAMIKAAARNGWIDEQRIMLETLTSIRRAGAGMILTYFAKDAAKLL